MSTPTETVQISAAFLEGLANELEEWSVWASGTDEGRIFQLSDNVRKALKRARATTALNSISNLESVLRLQGLHELADDIHDVGRRLGEKL